MRQRSSETLRLIKGELWCARVRVSERKDDEAVEGPVKLSVSSLGSYVCEGVKSYVVIVFFSSHTSAFILTSITFASKPLYLDACLLQI